MTLPPKLRLLPSAPTAREPASRARIAADDPRIARAAAGERDAAEALVRELLPRVRGLVRYLCRGDADVDDHTQVALLEVLRALPSFSGRSAFTTWVDRITVRTTLRRRAQTRARGQQERDADTHALEAHGPSPERHVETRRELARLLDALPEVQRTALVLHHAVGMSVPEIAEELSLPFDTVKSRLRLAVARLRALTEIATPLGPERHEARRAESEQEP